MSKKKDIKGDVKLTDLFPVSSQFNPLITEINTDGYFDMESLPKVYTSEGLQCLGLTVNKTQNDKIKLKDYHKFLKACKKIIESPVFEGVLAPPLEMDLIPHSKMRSVLFYRDKETLFQTPDEAKGETTSNKEDIQYRAMLIFYFKSNKNKEELKQEFGDIFSDEGGLPNK